MNERLLPGFGLVSTEMLLGGEEASCAADEGVAFGSVKDGTTPCTTPLGMAERSDAASVEPGEQFTDRRWEGLGTVAGPFSALATQISRRTLSHATLAQGALGADEIAFGRAWHVPCAPAVTLLASPVTLIAEEAGLTRSPEVVAPPCAALPVILPLLGLFVLQMRGISENTYMFHEPFVIDHSTYSERYGDHATPLREVVREAVAWYRMRQAPAG